MGTRKIHKKSNKRFRKTRSKRQRGIVGGINKTKKPTRKRRLHESKRKTYRHTEEEEETEEEQKHKIEMERIMEEISNRPHEVPSLFDLAADSLPPDVASEYNAESGEFSHVDLNPRRRNRFGGKRKTRRTKTNKRKNRKTRSKGGGPSPEKEPNDNCPICKEHMDNVENIVTTDCDHTFHKNCLRTWCQSQADTKCPICREPISNTCETKLGVEPEEMQIYEMRI